MKLQNVTKYVAGALVASLVLTGTAVTPALADAVAQEATTSDDQPSTTGDNQPDQPTTGDNQPDQPTTGDLSLIHI